MAVKRYAVDICDACIRLDGEQCHDPHCTFCRCSMREVSAILDKTLIRPIIDGVQSESLQHGEDIASESADV